MAVKIRLARGGAKKKPFYKVVVATSTSPRDGKFIEVIGTFDPLKPKGTEDRFAINIEALNNWMSKGALPSDRVAKLAMDKGIQLPAAVVQQVEKLKKNPKRAPRKASGE
ncbi:MAG: 30S ribosomal protein S16 [Sphingobacteriia bacterium]|nr:30S ribosomal protein S16 [Sphingobacteriia bacterium]